MATDKDWLETKVYSFRELLSVMMECKNRAELKVLSEYYMSYKKKYSLSELDKLMKGSKKTVHNLCLFIVRVHSRKCKI